ALNDGRKGKESYKLFDVYQLPNNLILLAVYNEKEKFLFNILNQEGNITKGKTVCFRTIQLIVHEFKDKIPEIVVRFRVTEINIQLTERGKTTEQIEKIWEDCFSEVKERQQNKK